MFISLSLDTACIHSLQANCTTTCPDGYFGDKCLGICNCAKSQVCDADIGCVNSTYGNDQNKNLDKNCFCWKFYSWQWITDMSFSILLFQRNIFTVQLISKMEIRQCFVELETTHIIIVVSGSCGLTLLIGITVYCIRKKLVYIFLYVLKCPLTCRNESLNAYFDFRRPFFNLKSQEAHATDFEYTTVACYSWVQKWLTSINFVN